MTDSMKLHFDDEDERVSAGTEGLDDVLNGGFPQGHFFLIEGEPGTGKTTLGLQFLMQGARTGEKSLYVTLSESKREIEKVARSHRWSLEGVTIFEFTPTEDSLRPEDQYSAFHPSEVLGQYLERFGAIYLRKVDKLFRRIAFDTGTWRKPRR